MNELIKITTKGDQQLVSARDVHEYLEVKKHFTEWFDDNKTMFTDGLDYQAFHLKVKAGAGTSIKTDYSITLDCAKELCMMSKVAKGKEARQYFIECEKQLKGKVVSLPDYPEALRQLAQNIEYSTQLQQQINEAKPAVSFYEATANTSGLLYFRDAAKSLKFEKLGQNGLFQFCRDNTLLDAKNQPYQNFVNMGIFEVIIGNRPDGKGGKVVTSTTMITGKGLEYLHKFISNKRAA